MTEKKLVAEIILSEDIQPEIGPLIDFLLKERKLSPAKAYVTLKFALEGFPPQLVPKELAQQIDRAVQEGSK